MNTLKMRTPVGHDISAPIHSKVSHLAFPKVHFTHADDGEMGVGVGTSYRRTTGVADRKKTDQVAEQEAPRRRV